MNILDLIPGGRTVQLAVVAVLAALLIGGVTYGVHSYNESLRSEGRAEVQVKWDKAAKEQEQRALAEAAANAAETNRRLAAQQESQRAHDLELAQARADAASAASAADRLRARANQLAAAARRSAINPAVVGNSETASSAADVLADVLGRVVERARQLASFSDESRAAGLQCQREYEELKP
jgi:uncharacterized protein HemX